MWSSTWVACPCGFRLDVPTFSSEKTPRSMWTRKKWIDMWISTWVPHMVLHLMPGGAQNACGVHCLYPLAGRQMQVLCGYSLTHKGQSQGFPIISTNETGGNPKTEASSPIYGLRKPCAIWAFSNTCTRQGPTFRLPNKSMWILRILPWPVPASTDNDMISNLIQIKDRDR